MGTGVSPLFTYSKCPLYIQKSILRKTEDFEGSDAGVRYANMQICCDVSS